MLMVKTTIKIYLGDEIKEISKKLKKEMNYNNL